MSIERRKFLRLGAAATAGAATSRFATATDTRGQAPAPFKLRYAPHAGMFRHHAGEDVVSQIDFMVDTGFTAFEDNGMRERPVAEQERIANALQRHGMRMGVFVANSNGFGQPSFTKGDPAMRDTFLADCRTSVEVAKRVDAKWMTVVMGDLHPRLEMDYQTAHAVGSLRRAVEIFEPHGLIMVLEPLNPWRDHPGMFLTKIPQAYMICKAVDSPSCKILFDIYHQQITEGNLIPNIDLAWDEIAYFQIGDNPGRNEPTTGEINYRNVFKHIHGKKYDGVLGMEHGNSIAGKEGEAAVIAAYRDVDAF
jgi:hydroxypyruvate isomerase